ncbi:hypothetical protein ACP275_09G052000 [Erythranthe tilingii]
MEREQVGEGSVMPCGPSKQKKVKLGGATKKAINKREVDDDSWMPEGWVKRVNKRPLTGKFTGYEDKKYYAPGVSRAFRSKVKALRYKEQRQNITATGLKICGGAAD